MTLNTIMKELKQFPADKLDDLYFLIHSINPKRKKSSTNEREKKPQMQVNARSERRKQTLRTAKEKTPESQIL